MAKNKVWVEGEPCKKCGHPVEKHKEYPKDHMYTFCFICWGCSTTYFNKRLEVIKRVRTQKKQKKQIIRKIHFETVKERYFGNPVKDVDDLIDRMKDVMVRYKRGRSARSMLLRLFMLVFKKRKDKHPHNYPKEDVLKVMVFLASQDLKKKFWSKETTNAELREEYDEKKWRETWRPHISARNCYICDERADVRHHVIPLKNGGHNSFLNIRSLCNSCHADVHPWLK